MSQSFYRGFDFFLVSLDIMQGLQLFGWLNGLHFLGTGRSFLVSKPLLGSELLRFFLVYRILNFDFIETKKLVSLLILFFLKLFEFNAVIFGDSLLQLTLSVFPLLLFIVFLKLFEIVLFLLFLKLLPC